MDLTVIIPIALLAIMIIMLILLYHEDGRKGSVSGIINGILTGLLLMLFVIWLALGGR